MGDDDDDDGEAITLANDSPTGSPLPLRPRTSTRLESDQEIRAGCVWVNDHIPIISGMPHGGMKESGFGKDMSRYSFDDYKVVKHVMYDITGTAAKDWHRTIFAKPDGDETRFGQHRR